MYTAGRLSAVAVRPLCLFIANEYLAPEAAIGVAIAYLATSLALVTASADPHRPYYARHFAPHRQPTTITFYVYLVAVTWLGALGSVAVAAIALYYTGSIPTAGAAVLYFVSEKLADERLRFKLFDNAFEAWGRAAILRSVLQVAGLTLLLLTAADRATGWGAVLILAAANLLVFVRGIPGGWFRLVTSRVRRVRWLAHRAAASLVSRWQLWAIALFSGATGYVDRVVALVFDTSVLPVFMMIVMVFSIIQLAVDYYYVSTHRRSFLRGEIAFGSALRNPRFLGSLGGGLLVAGLVCAVVLRVARNADTFPIAYVVGIALLQTAIAIGTVPQQIVYWSSRVHYILAVEGVFWIVVAATIAVGVLAGLPPLTVLTTAVLCAWLRCAAYAVVAGRAPRASYL